MQYKTIFIDLDDTLIDTVANSVESLKEIYDKYSFKQYYETFDEFRDVYMPFNLSLWDAYERHEITKKELMASRFYTPFKHINGITEERGEEINLDFMERTSSKKNLIEGCHEVLENLKKQDYRICVLSNGFEEVQYKKIDTAGLNAYFDKIILSDHIGINKPDPAIFDYALKQMNTSANESIMIGDNWASDILGAHNSHINQVWYNPYNKASQGFTPTHTVTKLMEVNLILSAK